VSAVHGLLSLQSTPMPAHFPAVHLSPMVQALPSSHIASSGLFTLAQPVIVSQLSTVQSLLSLHVTGVPAWHLPVWHESPCVQTLLSVQGVLLATGSCAHPPPWLQASVVQTLPSSVHGAPAGL